MYDLIDQPAGTLCRNGHFLLWAMRGWKYAIERRTCPPFALHRAFRELNAQAVLPDFHVAMALLHSSGNEKLILAPLNFPLIVEDEAILLSLWRNAASANTAGARETLALLVGEKTACPTLRAMGSAITNLRSAGFDLAQLAFVT